MIGIVFKKNGQNFWVNFDNEKNVLVKSRGKVKQTTHIFIGDYVEVVKINDEYIIERILERKNCINRPAIANVDVLMIIQSVKEPDLSIHLLNTYLAFYENKSISNVCIFLTKIDLLTKKEKEKLDLILTDYAKESYMFFSYEEKDFARFNKVFDKNLVCFAGQSGVGKSTIINKILPNSNIFTQEISKSLNRGKHTTTTSTLLEYKDGYVADTPGFSSVTLDMNKFQYSQAYNLYRELSTKCKYSNCLHINERDCFIIKQFELDKICKLKYLDYLETIKKLPN
ncbi:MAG: ribosome small subunit-dependent GTPase A [Malacoplasma sp.]